MRKLMLLGALPALMAGAAAAQPVQIGNVAAANRAVLGTPPGLDRRELELGVAVNAQERIETRELGAGQFIFLDQTTLNIWPNSDIVLDRFVYDPAANKADMSMTMTRGFLRFIGGRASKQEEVEVATPNGFVFIRGGIAQISVTGDLTRVVHIAGEYTRLNDVTLSRANAVAQSRSLPGGGAETTFLGVLNAEEVAALYGLPFGRGAGGLADAPDDLFAARLIEGAGLDRLGSQDVLAARSPRVSTLGETERPIDDAPFAAPEPATRDRQIPVQEQVAQAGAGEGGGAPIVRPIETPPVTPPGVVSTPSPGLVGALFAADGTDTLLLGDGLALLAVSTLTLGTQTAVMGEDAASSENVRIDAPVAGAGFVRLPAASTGGAPVTTVGRLDGRAARVDVFAAPGVFFLGAFSATEGDPRTALGFFGAPTPAAFWGAGGPQRLATYATSTALFSGSADPLPADLGSPFGTSVGFTLLSDASGAFTDPAAPSGGDARLLAASLTITGEGAAQRSSFGAGAGALGRSANGAPLFAAPFALSTRIAADGALGQGDFEIGAVTTPDGVWGFGATGDFAVVGAEAAFSPAPGVAATGFDDTRVASRAGGEVLATARTPLALAVGGSPFAGAADDAVESVFTGGFAVAQGQAFRPAAGSQPSQPYILLGAGQTSVVAGFAPDRNGVAVELSDLEPVNGGDGLTGVRLAFGDLSGRDGLIDDNRFAALATTRGRVTGSDAAASGQALRTFAGTAADSPHGGLAAAGLTGDGGVFPTGVDASPEFLRWGWWNGEIAFADATADPAFAARRDRLHLGAWVGGVVSDIADVRAQSGIATYDGLALAQVIESGPGGAVAYAQGGRFSMVFDLDDSQGSVTIAGILGETVSFPVTRNGATGGNHFGGAVATGFVNGAGSGTIAGSFFTGQGSPVRAAAGTFSLDATAPSGAPATAAGIFAGDRVQ